MHEMAATPTADATNAPLATATDTTVDVVLPSATDTHMDTHMDTAAATNMTPPPKDVHSAALDWLCAPEHSGRLVKSLSVPRDEVTRLLGRVMGACDDHGFYHCREWAMLVGRDGTCTSICTHTYICIHAHTCIYTQTYRILSTGVTPTGAPVAPAADLLVEDARVTWPLDAKAGSASAAADAVEKAREQSAASPAVLEMSGPSAEDVCTELETYVRGVQRALSLMMLTARSPIFPFM